MCAAAAVICMFSASHIVSLDGGVSVSAAQIGNMPRAMTINASNGLIYTVR